ncbi:MAG: class II aldolase/adducin family protein [Polyangiaceae bacterium]|nr:class II aldolase/adducin family protein [Polyangiaceae bacterium]
MAEKVPVTSKTPNVALPSTNTKLMPDLTPQQEFALLARILYREEFDDHLSGHITYKQPDGNLLVNPFELTWDELKASDVLLMDVDGKQLDGKWSVTPAIKLHTEFHKVRHDAIVTIHNHPKWSSIWASKHTAPPIYDQSSAMFAGEVAVYNEFTGNVADPDNATKAVAGIGDAKVALLANHGVFITGESIRQAYQRATTLEWRSKQAWHIDAVGGGIPVEKETADFFGKLLDMVCFPGLWEAMVRRELRADPTVLD